MRNYVVDVSSVDLTGRKYHGILWVDVACDDRLQGDNQR